MIRYTAYVNTLPHFFQLEGRKHTTPAAPPFHTLTGCKGQNIQWPVTISLFCRDLIFTNLASSTSSPPEPSAHLCCYSSIGGTSTCTVSSDLDFFTDTCKCMFCFGSRVLYTPTLTPTHLTARCGIQAKHEQHFCHAVRGAICICAHPRAKPIIVISTVTITIVGSRP